MSAARTLKTAVIIGAGRMGAAMVRGWVRDLRAAGLASLSVIEPQPEAGLVAAAREGAFELNPKPVAADIVVLAVKPQGFTATAEDIKAWVGPDTLVISIMAGIAIEHIAKTLGAAKVLRAMPNTPGAIGKGVTGYALSPACGEPEQGLGQRLLAPLGQVLGPLREQQMDAVTAVSGSGPAYVFAMVEALAAAGRAAGLEGAVADVLARETVMGAGALLAHSDLSPEELRQAVTSPGGTTAAALDVLTATGALADLMARAVEAAAKRGAELASEKKA